LEDWTARDEELAVEERAKWDAWTSEQRLLSQVPFTALIVCTLPQTLFNCYECFLFTLPF
jgi:hypothetical protein